MDAKIRLYVDQPLAPGQAVALSQDQAHYLTGVMRLEAGAAILLFNGKDGEWRATLAQDYRNPKYHISLPIAVARRVRANYLWILLIQTLAYAGKLVVHPVAVPSFSEFVNRADIGPLPGEVVLIAGAVYISAGIALVVWVNGVDRRRAKDRAVRGSAMG